MKRIALSAIAMLLAGSAFASLVPVGPVPFSGTGLGAVNTILTVGGHPTESGCVARGPAGDIVGAAACPAGFTGGSEKSGASQTQTRTISELGLTTATDLRIVLNVNESTGNAVTLTNLELTIYSPSGTVLFTTGAFIAPTFPLVHTGGTTIGYVFQLDATQAAQAQLVFAGTNRIGLAATLTGATAGDETFFVADVTAIGVPITGADMAITKAATPTGIAGSNITYTLSAINNGPLAASNAVVSDVLPAEVRFVSVAAPAGWSCTTPAVGANGTVSCTKGSVAVAETAAFTIVARLCPELACGSVVTNTATATSTTIDPVTANGTSTATTTVQAQADVAIAKTASATAVNPGGTLIYELVATNAGPSNSAGTTIVDTLPLGFTAVNVVSTSGTCSGAGTGTISCNIGTIGATGQCATAFPTSATVTITAQADPAAIAGSYTNTATVATANCLADPNLANNTATTNTLIPAGPVGADLAITKIAPATVISGNTLTYSINVTNSGPASASTVVVDEPLPSPMRFVSMTTPAGWNCTAPAAGTTGTINCTKASMAVAETAVFTAVVRVCPDVVCGTVMTNTATVSSATADPLPANNSSTATVTAQTQSDLAITKTASPSNVQPGMTVTYTLSATNRGPSNSVTTVVVDTLPVGLTAVSASSSLGSCSGTGTRTVTCTLGTVGAPNQCATTLATGATMAIVAQVDPASGSAIVTNVATISSGNCLADANPGDNTAIAVITIGSPGGGGGSAPVMSGWGLLVFALLLVVVGLYFQRAA